MSVPLLSLEVGNPVCWSGLGSAACPIFPFDDGPRLIVGLCIAPTDEDDDDDDTRSHFSRGRTRSLIYANFIYSFKTRSPSNGPGIKLALESESSEQSLKVVGEKEWRRA